MMRKVILLSIALSVFQMVLAQEVKTETKTFKERIYWGGSFNVGVGSYNTTIGVSPSVLYELKHNLGVGMNLTYLYSKLHRQDVSSHVFGAGFFMQYNPIRELQLLAEFEPMHVIEKITNDSYSYNVSALYFGVGYAIGQFGSIGFKYDVLWKEGKSVYREPFNPYIRIFF